MAIGRQVFKSITDLENVTTNLFRTAQENALNRLLEDLNDLISQDVYDGQKSGFTGLGLEDGDDYYDPTGSLLEMFGVTKVYKKGNQVYGSIDVVNPSLDRDAEHWIHASKIVSGNFLARNLLDIMINGQSLSNGIWEHAPHTFWEDFQKLAQKQYPIYFAEECQKLGIPMSLANAILGNGASIGKTGTITNIT